VFGTPPLNRTLTAVIPAPSGAEANVNVLPNPPAAA